MSIYIDSYNIKIKGEEWKNGKCKDKNALKSNWASDEGMSSKAFIDMVEQISDSTDSGASIHIDVTLNNHREN